jgi:hypothetical protein
MMLSRSCCGAASSLVKDTDLVRLVMLLLAYDVGLFMLPESIDLCEKKTGTHEKQLHLKKRYRRSPFFKPGVWCSLPKLLAPTCDAGPGVRPIVCAMLQMLLLGSDSSLSNVLCLYSVLHTDSGPLLLCQGAFSTCSSATVCA